MARKERNKKIDLLRAIAIILVIIGHCIQYGSGGRFLEGGLFYDNILFKIIYSFHMPLFMLISGYLFYNSACKYDTKTLLKKRTVSLLVPIISFSCINFVIAMLSYNGYPSIPRVIVNSVFGNIWFLWSVLVLSLLAIINRKFLNDSIVVYLLVFVACFFAPAKLNIQLYAYLYPFFIAGYMLNKYKKASRFFDKPLILLSLALPIFLLMICFYDRNSYVYTAGVSVLGNPSNILNDLFRMAIGFVGSIAIVSIVVAICRKKVMGDGLLCYIGKNTLGIYAISNYLFLLLKGVTQNMFGINYFLLTVETVAILFASLTIIYLIKKSSIMSRLLLGVVEGEKSK